MSEQVYLDYNASAPLLEEAKIAMTKAFALYGNPSSVHGAGRGIRAAIEHARDGVAELLGGRAQDVIWTSGGTEANNLALTPSLFARNLQSDARLFVSAIEHPSVLNGMRFERETISIIPVLPSGVIDVDWLKTELFEGLDDEEIAAGFVPGSRPILVSVMTANNETGVVQPIHTIAEIVHKAGGLLHTDCVQALGKIQVSLPLLDVDLMSVSGHKIGAPHGVGALVVKDASIVLREPLVAGGGQELKRRGGTENVLGIIGFGAAAKVVHRELSTLNKSMTLLRDKLEAGLLEISPEVVIFGRGQQRLPNVCCFGIPGFSAETQVIQMDLEGVAVSSGSACSSGKVEASHVLKAMGVGDDLSSAALRVSLGPKSSEADVDRFLSVWGKIYGRVKLRGMPGGQAA